MRLVFDYYKRLTARQQSVYRQSDAVAHILLPAAAELRLLVPQLEAALKAEDQRRVEAIANRLASGMNSQLKAPGLRVQVLAVRPSSDWGELHGLYLPEEDGRPAKIQLWMRTAKHKRVVAFKTFLRTLLHELCHHFDYELYRFPETFHTEGFYNRESSLFRQLAPQSVAPAKARANTGARQR